MLRGTKLDKVCGIPLIHTTEGGDPDVITQINTHVKRFILNLLIIILRYKIQYYRGYMCFKHTYSLSGCEVVERIDSALMSLQ